MEMTSVKKSIITAMCIALCVVLPQAFHAIPNGGTVYSPLHIPVLLCGLICGGTYGLLCGIAGVLLSALLTGMPPAAVMPPMLVECAVYGGIAGLLMKVIRTGNVYADLFISLVGAMIMGRAAAGLVRGLIFSAESYSLTAWMTSYFVTALPGIILHLILIPVVYFALIRAHLIPERYLRD